MGTRDDRAGTADGTWYPVTGDSRALDRAVRRGRRPRFPPNLSGEDYRRLLLEHIDTLGNADSTDAERAETAQWRLAVSGARTVDVEREMALVEMS